ncbi:bifunctional 3-(3-hydroxy-phenyl)propionate/3-hydroxycinnamic acid hydroxylase [Streptomyces albipurpureus]|uniref:Bifunctional 3-(3-hydroxy-phenyl)propionate/3-hydroxycinnamic acid hydroxylase n=1 Tax=Streptomyces albipurpureus TaxID=2897419 RepID=A0ABT0UZP5_9ACTN|nr:bifunctional 3-(3-hydroxy-phenyl)propionate/3-hydroxycinnamic acid hydroxylase [Streptomyces sp. CWNU-1]MCM2393741.1 bifunctional 3-(3-hydroxy-phenyl)propionate/3-hydroxycinnamic acid hydroxylase [Streptomyces sp. CWNU-1]
MNTRHESTRHNSPANESAGLPTPGNASTRHQDPGYEVAIIGFGPVGMVLAGLLGRRGIRVLVVEKSPEVYPLPRAAHIDHTGLRTLQELGCLDELLPRMLPNRGLALLDASLRRLVRVPGDQGSVSGLPASMYFYQPEFDRTLDRVVSTMETVEVRRGLEMVSLEPEAEGVTVRCLDRMTGATVRATADWLIGCDGANSSVRRTLGVTLDSLGFDEEWLVLDLVDRLGRDDLLTEAIQVCDPRRPYVANPMPHGRYRAEFMLFPGDDPEHLKERASLERLLAPVFPDLLFDVERSAVYTFHGLSARSWRAGRVLLAGDAAHQMPPFLGQGMCSGLRDASNLAWKLARVLRGKLPAALLDTYESERAPHVRKVVASAVEFGRFVSISDPQEAAERDRRLLSGEDSRPLRFQLPPLAPGTLVHAGGGTLFPQPTLDGSTRLDDEIGDRFLLIARTPDQLTGAARWWTTFDDCAVLTLGDLGQATESVSRWLDRRDADFAVVRPDRCVLAAGRDLGAVTEELRTALRPPALATRLL